MEEDDNMGMSVIFDGHDLREYFEVIQGFTPHDGADWRPSIIDGESAFGSPSYLYTSKGPKTLEMPFMMQWNLGSKYDDLQRILSVKEPKRLEIGAFPDRYCMAIPQGTLEMHEGAMEAAGKITWLITDGVWYAKEKRTYPLQTDTDGRTYFEVTNNGTDDCHVDFEFTMQSDNGYIGVASEYGAIELGNIQEADGHEVMLSDHLFVSQNKDFSSWSAVPRGERVPGGTDKMALGPLGIGEVGMGVIPSVTNTYNTAYYGGGMEYVLEDPASDWYWFSKARWETGLMGQTGNMTIAFISDEGNLIGAWSITKDDTTGNTCRVVFEIGATTGTLTLVQNRIFYQPTRWLKDNPYGSEAMQKNRNMFDVRKEGNKIRFFHYGQYYTYTLNNTMKDWKLGKVMVFVGQYRNRNLSTSNLVTFMQLEFAKLDKINVPSMADDPNRYAAGDWVQIKGEEGKVYYNNMPRLEDEIVGSTYFKVPPGTTRVEATFSDFANPKPVGSASIREVFN